MWKRIISITAKSGCHFRSMLRPHFIAVSLKNQCEALGDALVKVNNQYPLSRLSLSHGGLSSYEPTLAEGSF